MQWWSCFAVKYFVTFLLLMSICFFKFSTYQSQALKPLSPSSLDWARAHDCKWQVKTHFRACLASSNLTLTCFLTASYLTSLFPPSSNSFCILCTVGHVYGHFFTWSSFFTPFAPSALYASTIAFFRSNDMFWRRSTRGIPFHSRIKEGVTNQLVHSGKRLAVDLVRIAAFEKELHNVNGLVYNSDFHWRDKFHWKRQRIH